MSALLIFLIVLSVLVLFHEAGHYLAARLFGVKAEEFGFGFPPRALGFVKVANKWKRLGSRDKNSFATTIWSLNWLPLGGFVRLKGEQGEVHSVDSFASQALGRRALILVAGVSMNWFLAWLIFSIGFTAGVPIQTDNLPAQAVVQNRQVQIDQVIKGSAADQAGIMPGDVILRVDGTTIGNISEAQNELAARSTNGSSLHLSLKRGTDVIVLETAPRFLESLKRPGLGIGLIEIATVRFPWYQAFGQAASVTYGYTRLILKAFGTMLSDLFLHRRVSADLSGPIGIAVMTGQIAEQGSWAVAEFAALLSINLALINILPIPALDGGRLLFVAIEAIRRRPGNQRLEAAVHQIGFFLLISLIILVTFHDVQQYGGIIWRGLTSIIR